jgi:hypothetical protein
MFAVSKSGPAASAKELGSGQNGGRGRGNGTFSMDTVALRTAFFENPRALFPGFDFALIAGDARELSLRRCTFRRWRSQLTVSSELLRYLSDRKCDPWNRTKSSADRAWAATHAYAVTISTAIAVSQRNNRLFARMRMIQRLLRQKLLLFTR